MDWCFFLHSIISMLLSLSRSSTSFPVIYGSSQEPYITVGLKAVHSLWTFSLNDQQQLAIQYPALCNETIRFHLVSCAHLHFLIWRTKRLRAGLLIRAICVTPFTVVNSKGREPVSDWPPVVDMSHQWKTTLWLVPACRDRRSQICVNFLPERQVRQINKKWEPVGREEFHKPHRLRWGISNVWIRYWLWKQWQLYWHVFNSICFVRLNWMPFCCYFRNRL